jgi:hypothetical protein
LLKPFLLASEVKNGKLVTLALAAFQKFAANKGVGAEGRAEIIKALANVGSACNNSGLISPGCPGHQSCSLPAG